MLESFIVVGTQVTILFILISLGFICGKTKLINKEGIVSINNIMLYIITPCVIINAFQRDFDPSMLKNLLLSTVGAIISHAVSYALAYSIIHNKDEAKRKVQRFAAIFSNCGFMALPLLEALLGDEGLFYGAGYLAVFNICVWSLGQYSLAKGVGKFSGWNAILNAGVLSAIVGIIFFVTSFKLPLLIGAPVSYLAALNTPVPMLIIGYTISKLEFKDIANIKEEALALLIRLIVSPCLLMGILYLIGFRGNLFIATIVSASTPVAAISTMFSIKYCVDESISSKLVAISSLFSIATMTIIISIARTIA